MINNCFILLNHIHLYMLNIIYYQSNMYYNFYHKLYILDKILFN